MNRLVNIKRLLKGSYSFPLPARRLLSTGKLPRIAYECSKWSIADHELTLLERSIHGGCQTVITRSSAHLEDVIHTLEDLHNEDNPIDDLQVSHLLSLNRETTIEEVIRRYEEEVNILQKTFSKHLHVIRNVLLQVPLETYTNSEKVYELLVQLRGQGLTDARWGVFLDTAQLSTLQTESTLEKHVLKTLLHLYHNNDFKALALSCNACTSSIVMTIREQLKQQQQQQQQQEEVPSNLNLLAVELLRTQSKKPGQLSGQYDYQGTHQAVKKAMIDDGKPILGDADVSQALRNAAEDFKVSVDRCFQLENIFLEKHRSTLSWAEEAHRLCIAHIFLGSTATRFDSPEEYDLVVAQRIQQSLDEQMDRLMREGGPVKDWALLYQPSVRYLLVSYRHLLQTQMLEKVGKLLPECPAKLFPYSLAQITAQALDAETAGLTLHKIDPFLIQESLDYVKSHSQQNAKEELRQLHSAISADFQLV